MSTTLAAFLGGLVGVVVLVLAASAVVVAWQAIKAPVER
jgi:hypothetical protein